MSGHHSSSHHVSSFNHSASNANNTNTQHHHTPSRLTRATLTSALGQQQSNDMRVPTFPIDPNLGGPSSTASANAISAAAAAAVGLSTPTNQPLPSFQHHYNTRPQSSGDPRSHYNAAPTTGFPTPDFHHNVQHQTPQTDYSGYDTSFGTEDQGTPTINTGLPPQNPSSITDPESQEIRRLAFAALTQSIEVIANRTRSEENGPNGEKARQMFGMSWLMRNCEVNAGATPRNRVYARYVSLCAAERLKPLNPASFGKLVRAVYPDIKTRRLGIRGQSKYHYCGIKLRDDDPNAATPDISGDMDDSIKYIPFNSVLMSPNLNSRPSSVVPSGFHEPASPPPGMTMEDREDYLWLARVKNAPLRFVSFPSATENSKSSSNDFQVPHIEPYVPAGMDEDAVNTLSALYITHTVGLIEAIRYVKMKQFLSLISGFHGTLTAPVQRVLNSPALAPWVQKADFAMYKEITRILSPLALQVVPPTILNSLRSLSSTLPDHIQTTFANHAPTLLRAKLIPATAFARLLCRLIRVNDTAHAAARFLANPADRELMRSDWLRFVSPKAIVQRELPCGEVLAEQILREEVVNLLSPENPFSNGQNGDSPARTRNDLSTPPRKRARMDAQGNSNPPTFATFDSSTEINEPATSAETLPPSDGASMTQGVLDQWAMWLCKLPERFPNVPPRVFLWCMESVGAGALRDITVAGGEGFGAWWVVRCWMDEWMGWIAEKGGFLDMDSETELTGNIIHNVRSAIDVGGNNDSLSGLLGDTLTY